MVSPRLLLEEEDVVMVAWSLAMQKHELFITLQLFKMNIAKLKQYIHYDGVIGNSSNSNGLNVHIFNWT
jgi:hypothetical protein